MTVGGGEPKATLSLAQAQEASEAVPPDEPPSPPLTPDDRVSVQADLDEERQRLERLQAAEPLPGMVWKRNRQRRIHEAEIARLKWMLEER